MPKRILLVDDDPAILNLLENCLGKKYLVSLARDGEEALKKAFETRPDLVITDVMMPKKNGFELCNELRFHSQLCDVPIIMLTALGRDEDKLQGFRMGADDFIVKPFSPAELKERVDRLLERTTRAVAVSGGKAPPWEAPVEIPKGRISTGIKKVDTLLGGGLPISSNLLLIGPLGTGKSSFCRNFVAEGLRGYEPSLFVIVDDNPTLVKEEMNHLLGRPPLDFYETNKLLALVDANSWATGLKNKPDRQALDSFLEINHLSKAIAEAGLELGQNPIAKRGGRRVVDSISSLFAHFELAVIQGFLANLIRASTTHGGVTTVLTLEKGVVEERFIDNIKYLMDGVFETKKEGGQLLFRVASMKWLEVSDQWIRLT
jgi:CheY-like chemotaxis protein/KaiC/GvpD/RAD55 family RecA-like ATPase